MKKYKYTGETRKAMQVLINHYKKILSGDIEEAALSLPTCPLCTVVDSVCNKCPWVLEYNITCIERALLLAEKDKKWDKEVKEALKPYGNHILRPRAVVCLRNSSKKWAKMRLKEIERWIKLPAPGTSSPAKRGS